MEKSESVSEQTVENSTFVIMRLLNVVPADLIELLAEIESEDEKNDE